MYNILEISFLFVLIISVVYSYSIQDPIPTLVKVNHNNTISKWREVPIQKFPNFAISTLNIFQIPMDEKGLTTDFVNSRIPINLKSDLKISLNFDNSRLVTPWITIYDSIQRKSLKKLKVIFSHDEYEIIKITYETQFSPTIQNRIDSSHPALRSFEIEYVWEQTEGESLEKGAQILSFFTLICVIIIFGITILNSDLDEPMGPECVRINSGMKKKIFADNSGWVEKDRND